MKTYIQDPPEKLEDNTVKKYSTCLSHLKSFKKQLHFSDIDNSLINEFHKYMSRTLNLEGATYKKYMEASKRIIRQARKENYLNPSDGLTITLFLYHTEDNTHSKAMIKTQNSCFTRRRFCQGF